MSAAGKTSGRRISRSAVVRAIPPDALPAPVPSVVQTKSAPEPSRTNDIRDFGAVADNRTDCTSAINDAITACAQAGGGRVLIPQGQWLTGAIHLRSDIELHLSDGATLRFSDDPGLYLPSVFVRWGGQECFNYSPLIYARDCENIAITGAGRLRGGGAAWWEWTKQQDASRAALYEMVLSGVPVAQRQFGSPAHPLRPQFIHTINCTNVLLEDFTIEEGGPFWSVHLAYCRSVTIRRLRVSTPRGPHVDGITIDSSRDVLIEDCDLHTAADCLTLKSGMNEDGLRIDKPAENVLIRRVRATAGTGGISIGSDMSGGVRNVVVQECMIDNVGAGIRLKAARGRGGVVESIQFRDIKMGRIDGDAIQLTTEYPSFVQPAGKAPIFRDIEFRNITCDSAQTAARMIGLPDSALRNIHLEDVTILAEEGLKCSSCSALRLVNVRITPRTGPVLSVRDSHEVLIHGLNHADGAGVFLDLRGKQTREIRLRHEPGGATSRPSVLLGIDVPRDALVHE